MFGTDFPFEIGDAEGRLAMPTLDALDPAVREAVLGGTMQALLEGATA